MSASLATSVVLLVPFAMPADIVANSFRHSKADVRMHALERLIPVYALPYTLPSVVFARMGKPS